MRLWVGGNAASRNGEAEGIALLQAGDAESPWASGPLGLGPTVVKAPGSPSWLSAHPSLDVLYAALEADGDVQAYRRTGETTLAPLGRPVAAGSGVCHVGVSPDGAFLIASCWNDGRVVRMPLDEAGRPSSPSIAPPAADPYGPADSGPREVAVSNELADLGAAARALRAAAGEEFSHLVPDYDATDAADPPRAGDDGAVLLGEQSEASEVRPSRAHQSVFLGGGLVATTDMGLDLVRFWRATGGGLRFVQEVAMPKGSGPRHTVWHPSGYLYVLTELSCEVYALRAGVDGVWAIVSGVALSPEVQLGSDTAAEITPSHDRETLYAGVRGSDALGVVRISGDGSGLTPVAFVEAGTHWPRNHVVVRDTVLVAGQRANEVVSLLIDERTGIPGRVRHRTAVASPTCLLPLR
ncbi:lactonase family protein [Microbacterium sp. P07]|uniref:lactonase family protein n=1 Tax=Microbacterium sp. P07 TaxID=3366952 RepID=UPI0037467225